MKQALFNFFNRNSFRFANHYNGQGSWERQGRAFKVSILFEDSNDSTFIVRVWDNKEIYRFEETTMNYSEISNESINGTIAELKSRLS